MVWLINYSLLKCVESKKKKNIAVFNVLIFVKPYANKFMQIKSKKGKA